VTPALRLLDVDYFVICDFESLRLTGWLEWLTVISDTKTSAVCYYYCHFIQWPHICYSAI